ncbi:MAG TPA: hypothetical protein VKQ28_17305, partial [Candidatus Acidoferrum sp.]|nr:hypothetical protein [Candidatus Acidoferrum sp.]
LDMGAGRVGGGNRSVNKAYVKTFPCSTNAVGLMSNVENNFASFANYQPSSGDAFTIFSPGPVSRGGRLLIDAQLPQGNFEGVTGIPFSALSGTTSAVQVANVMPTTFSFQTVQGQHPFYPGTVTFAATDAGNGQITFSVNVSSDFANLFYRAAFDLVGASITASALSSDTTPWCAGSGVKGGPTFWVGPFIADP